MIYPILTSNLFWVNYSYVIIDSASNYALVVDPAWELEKITDLLQQLGGKLKGILLTHSHYDHTNLVDQLVHKFDLPVFISEKESSYYNFTCPNLSLLAADEAFYLGDTKILCMLTPGHTAGSMCYFLPEGILTGDTLFIEGCGICSCTGGSAEEMYASIQRLKSEVPDHVRVYPGHSYGKKPGETMSSLFKENIYFHFNKKEHFVNFRMRPNQKNPMDFKE